MLLREILPRAAELPPMLLVRVVRSTASCDDELARDLAAVGLSHPDLGPQTTSELQSIAAGQKESKALIALSREEESVNDAPGPALSLQSVITIPVTMEEDSLTLHLVGRGPMILKDERMEAVGAAEIREPGEEPYFVLDLFVDKPDPRVGRLRAFRCSTRSFDPRHLLPAEADADRAFLTIVGRILAGSGAPQTQAPSRQTRDPSQRPCWFSSKQLSPTRSSSVSPSQSLSSPSQSSVPPLVVWQPQRSPSPFITETATKVFSSVAQAMEHFEQSGMVGEAGLWN